MTCRVARSTSTLRRIGLAFCCECGSAVSGGVLLLESPGAASVSELRPVQGRVWNVEGNPDTITDEGAACRLAGTAAPRMNLTFKRQRKQKEDPCSVNAAEDCSYTKPSMA